MKIASEIDLVDVAKLFSHTDKKHKATIRWCENNGVPVHKVGKRKFVLDNEFSPAYDTFRKNPVTIPPELVPFEPEGLTSKTIKMDKVELKQNKQMSGLFLTCKCKSKPLYKHEDLIKCNCKAFRYKIRVMVPKKFRVEGGPKDYRSLLKATNYDDAIVELINFKKLLVKNSYRKDISHIEANPIEQSTPFSIAEESILQKLGPQHYNSIYQEKGPLLLSAIDKYLSQLDKKGHTKQNNAEAKRFLLWFIYVLESKYTTQVVKQLYFTQINFEMAEAYSDWLKKENSWMFNGKMATKVAYRGKTFDKAIGRLSSFTYRTNKNNNLNAPNYFDKDIIERSPKSYAEPDAFPIDEFPALLNAITPENGRSEWYSHNRNVYYDWLKDAFIFGLIAGGRRDAVVLTKWKNIEWSGNIPTRIKIEKYKLNRQSKIEIEKDKAFWTIDIDDDLEKYLVTKGLYENRGKDEYIIAPDFESREQMKTILTRAFTHFYKKLNTGKHYTFCKLRKTNFTFEAYRAIVEKREMNVEHTNINTTKKHYIDPAMLSKLKRQKTDVKLLG